eukprot:87732_1
MNVSTTVSVYTVLTIISISTIILLAIIIHLCRVYRQKSRLKNNQRQHIQFFLFITICAIILEELSLVLLIFVCIQSILLGGHVIHQDERWLDRFYHSSSECIETLIAVFDTTSHLGVILVFILRFDRTFNNNLFANQKHITALCFCTLFLFIGAVVIVILMCIKQPEEHIVIAEIAWEISVHLLWLWILFLFVSKLYDLLKFSLQTHIDKDGDNNHSTLLKSIIEATKISHTNSKDRSNPTLKQSANSNKSMNVPKSTMTMTIDGFKVEPTSRTKHASPPTSRHGTPETSPAPSMHSDGEQTDNEHSQINAGESTAIELIGVMTKMTILVSFAALLSVCGAISHGYLEMKHIEHGAEHGMAVEALWPEIFHVFDAVISSLMLYLQFNFTHKIYRGLFGRLDAWFLTQCLRIMECVWNKRPKDEKHHESVLMETNTTKTSEMI